jgi:hypothetical protein
MAVNGAGRNAPRLVFNQVCPGMLSAFGTPSLMTATLVYSSSSSHFSYLVNAIIIISLTINCQE